MAERDPIETLTGEHEQVPATPAEKAAVSSASGTRRKVMLGLAGAVLLAGGGWYALHDGSHVSTDNAYVNADSAQVTPLVSAAVVDVPVVNTQYVRRGDVLLRLDDSDARLAVARAEAAYLKARRVFGQSSATSGSLAAQVNARDADIGQAIDAADAVISAADTRGTVLTTDLLTARVAARPLVVVDIAMPRSVAADARLLDGLRYRTVDDLGSETTVSPEVIVACEEACRAAAAKFIDESTARDAAPVIAALQARADDLRRRKLDRALAKLGHLNQRDRDVVAGLAQALARGLLHEPTAALRTKPSRAGAACDLFGIEP